MMTVDFHSHILPGIDDGSRSVEESLAMLRLEAEQGIGRVVATPHFYARHDTPERFLTRRSRAEAALRMAMAAEKGLPQITLGAEVHFFRGMSESDALQSFTIGESKYILIEMPQSPWSEDFYRELEAVYTKQGLIPIIAHIDRYIAPFRTRGIPGRLEELPVLVQANAEFFLKAATASMALRLLKEERIHLLGSDCHDLSDRKPNLAAAVRRIERKLGRDALAKVLSYESRVLGDRA